MWTHKHPCAPRKNHLLSGSFKKKKIIFISLNASLVPLNIFCSTAESKKKKTVAGEKGHGDEAKIGAMSRHQRLTIPTYLLGHFAEGLW